MSRGCADGPSPGTKRSMFARPISVSSVYGGHSPDRRRKNARAQAKGKRKPPIWVERTKHGYRLIEGCDRVHFARQAGESTIRAYVWS